MDNNVSARDAALEILERVKEIATLFDRCDGKTNDAMICISISDGFIFINAADHGKEDFNWLFRLQYARDTAELIDLKTE